MGDLKKWIVTYTKHIKQKRKVYQDGFLELHCSTGTDKVLLYDDSEKLLDSRFLKKGEFVESGETLTFSGYLVDIGGLDKNCNPLSDSNSKLQEIAKKHKGNLGKMAGNSSYSMESDNCGMRKGTPENHPSVMSNITSEWRALYTTQKTQKSKKYHDGVLRLLVGAFDRKIVLYDDSEKQLDSRYLKKDEVVKCGETLTFDGYLVDIGDLEENCKPLVESFDRFHGKEAETEKSGSGKSAVPDNCTNVQNNLKKEWHALYTTQKTQKAKKYHDGILWLVVGVSHRKQVTLLDEDGTILSSKYLSSSEDVRTGSMLELANHLVEVGEARVSQEGEFQIDNTKRERVASCSSTLNVGEIKLNCSGTRNNSITSGIQNSTLSKEDLDSYSSSFEVEKDKFSQSGVRDARQILFTLKRPIRESSCIAKEPLMQQSSSSRLDSNLSSKNVIDNLEEKPEDDLESSNVGCSAQEIMHRSEILQSEDIHKLPTSAPANRRDEVQLERHISSSLSISIGETESKLTSETSCYPEKLTISAASKIAGPRVSDVIHSNLLLDTQMNTLVPHEEFDGGTDLKECPAITGVGVSSGCSGSDYEMVPDEKSNQLCADRKGTDTTCKEVVGLALRSLKGLNSRHNAIERENFKVLGNKAKEKVDRDDFPSFDLGF
ncbi:Dde family endonuclease [Thalictrum thalictroides]|uniref:Dde family endonuclease n=1 Tax=Thalictrum thalictroides TaxID=46969 RepID=A0A7J6X6C7_THATH|nr:Dde family endonuclease [Thalictrum thalictroides]